MASGDAFNHPSCTSSENGVWVADYGGSQGGGAAGAGFGAFIVIALLWAAAPAVIAGVVASSRGTSVGLSVLLGLVLGWIGLIIVVVAFKPEVKQAAEAVIRNASTTSPPAPARHDVAARLTQLDELKQRGLLSDDEYRNRRQVILDEI